MAWLLANAKWVIIGGLVLGLVGYITSLRVEVSHYKKSAASWEEKYTSYRQNAEANEQALKSANDALTLQTKQDNIARLAAQNAIHKQVSERIKNDATSRSIRIPDSSVRLYNDTTTVPDQQGQSARAGPDTSQNPQPAGTGSGSATLNDILQASEINNHELNLCVDEVIAWNKFWDRYTANVSSTIHVAPSQ